MYSDNKIAVVIPTYNAKKSIISVINSIPDFVDQILVVDDCCLEKSGQYVERANLPKVIVLFNSQNLGVGGAVKRGYSYAITHDFDIIVKIDADGQMDTSILHNFLNMIIKNHADYVKGNRFYFDGFAAGMPIKRKIGNLCLSFLNKLSSGYWHIFDPTNGYTAINKIALKRLNLNTIDNRFFFESDLLFRLHLIQAKVEDLPCIPIYKDEISNLNEASEISNFLFKNTRNFFKRVYFEYFIRDFSLASIHLFIGVIGLLFSLSYSIYNLTETLSTGIARPGGTILLNGIFWIISIQLLFSFINYDMNNKILITLKDKLF